VLRQRELQVLRQRELQVLRQRELQPAPPRVLPQAARQPRGEPRALEPLQVAWLGAAEQASFVRLLGRLVSA